MKNINNAINFTKKDVFNANNGKAIKDLVGEKLTVTGMAFGTDVMQETGEERERVAIKTDKGIVTSVSDTVKKSLLDLAPIIEEDGKAIVIPEVRTSAKGREFIVLILE